MESIGLNKITNLIFDFGGVLYEINQNRTLAEFRRMSSNKELFDNMGINALDASVFAEFETGKIGPGHFRKSIKNKYHISCSDDDFDMAWNATLIGIYNNIIDLLLPLSSRFSLRLLSNTNSIHFDYFYKDCEVLFGLFSNLFFSHEIGLRKPDIRIFEYIIDKSNIDPSATIYFDDSYKNCQSARKAGLKSVHVKNHFHLSDYLHTVNASTHIDY